MSWRVASDLGPHLARLHNLAIGARQVIELGVRHGTSTRALLAATAAIGGRVWSCDVSDPGSLDDIRDEPRWTFHVGDDRAAAACASAPAECDLLFIDTTHEREQTERELALYGWRVRPGGVIVMHDADPAPGQDVIGPALAYARKHERTLTYHPGSHGLAVIA